MRSKLWEIYVKLCIKTGLIKLDYHLEAQPPDEESRAKNVLNVLVTAEPRWFWKKEGILK